MKRKIKIAAALLAVCCVAVFGAAVLAAGGDAGDPLVTLSYLNNIFTPMVQDQVSAAVEQNEAALKAEVDASISNWKEQLKGAEEPEIPETSNFKVVTMTKGQVLTGSIGCEVMLRVGTATCVSNEAPGLIDCTDASILNNGKELVKNHLYMVTIETRGVKATANTVKVLVRGDYVVK